MIYVLGGGPTGLIVANILKNKCIPFKLITLKKNGFDNHQIKNLKYKLGQRTMFTHPYMDDFLSIDCGIIYEKNSLLDKVGIFYGNKIHGYPIQNNLDTLPIAEKLKIIVSYLFRNRNWSDSKHFATWVNGNYGSYLAKNIILPHTWKTIKEDLWTIDSGSFGQKVIPMKFFGKKDIEVFEYSNSDEILEELLHRVEDDIIYGNIIKLDVERRTIHYIDQVSEDCVCKAMDVVFNTLPLNTLSNFVKEKTDIIEVAFKSLKWNNMFISAMVVPTKFVRNLQRIIYFPSRDFIFSKVNVFRDNGISVIVSEVSFRRNDEDLLKSEAYCNKILEKIEYDLKLSGVLEKNLFVTYDNMHHILNYAYIICDEDYSMYNDILQSYFRHNKIYNVGRFAQWMPHMRLEHSLAEAKSIIDSVLSTGTVAKELEKVFGEGEAE